VRWSDVEDGGRWVGLDFSSERRQRPPLRIEKGSLLRVALRGPSGVHLVGKIESYWEWWTRAVGDAPVGAVVPLPVRAIRQIEAEPGTDAWLKAWAKWFATELNASAGSPLYGSRWRISIPRKERSWMDPAPPPPRVVDGVVEELGFREEEPLAQNRLLALRTPSRETSPRIKAWRKVAREGRLPPVLTWYWRRGLGVHVVLDGHDRLRAAALEKVTPTFLVLESYALRALAVTPEVKAERLRGLELASQFAKDPVLRESLNQRVIEEFRPFALEPTLYGWLMAGGVEEWTRVANALLAARGMPAGML
jgi:hypothetical protein